ncbi:MAG TPA: hypothetical protein VFQ61_37680 [Polyangiaceae bacterium]|nr:hypothetical protein [Polyangiaceae bacterium]
MSLVEKDLIRRLIQDLAKFFARLAGLRAAGELDQAERELSEMMRQALGPWSRDAEYLAVESLMKMLSRERLELYARLLIERGALAEARGQPERARRDQERARSLLDALARAGGATEAPNGVGLGPGTAGGKLDR